MATLLHGWTWERSLELVAVLTGLVYVLLILRRNRLGWIAGAASSTIYVYLAARAQLPMQSALQGYYVVMAVYGWVKWTRNASDDEGRIHRWSLRGHLLAVLFILAASVASAQLLARETHAAWPMLDSLTTWTSFIATWMVTRSVLENWFYWISADLVTIFLFASQGYPPSAALFLAYAIIACFGFRAWRQRWRQQPA
jgi:nicotinamide mononucleotide transporter